jgi:hypothetical protein
MANRAKYLFALSFLTFVAAINSGRAQEDSSSNGMDHNSHGYVPAAPQETVEMSNSGEIKHSPGGTTRDNETPDVAHVVLELHHNSARHLIVHNHPGIVHNHPGPVPHAVPRKVPVKVIPKEK